MRILKNNLYIQNKKKKNSFTKTPLINVVEQYKNILLHHINVQNSNKLLPNSVYNQNLTKKTKKYNKILFTSLLHLIVKKVIFYSIGYKKLLQLLDIWLLQNYTKYIDYLNNFKLLNNQLITFYIKKKCLLILTIIEKIKFNYLNQFLMLFFKTNKKLRYFLDNQINLFDLKHKNTNNLVQKIKTILYINLNSQLNNKYFFNDFLMLLKILKKETIKNIFNKDNKNIQINDFKKKKDIKKTNDSFFNIFIQTNLKTSYSKLNKNIKLHKLNTLQQVTLYSNNKSTPHFVINSTNQFRISNLIKWVNLNNVILTTNTQLFKLIFKTLIKSEIKDKIINLHNKPILHISKNINMTYFMSINIFSHLTNNKNTTSLLVNYMNQTTFLLNTYMTAYKWYVVFENIKKNLMQKNSNIKKKQKKSINILFNTLVNNLNKKFGITYNCILINDSLSYWTKDFNMYQSTIKHLVLITEIQKFSYKIKITKYLKNINIITAYNQKKIMYYVNNIKKNIQNNIIYNYKNKTLTLTS